MSLSVKTVTREHALAVWADIEPLVQKAVEVMDNEDTLDVLGRILTGEYQCMVVCDGGKPICAIVTQFINNRRGKVCNIAYVGGEGLTKWLYFVDDFISWCNAQGCSRVEGIGRIGWERVLAEKGFRRIATSIRKQL